MVEQTLKEKTAKGLFWGGLSNGIQQIISLGLGIILACLLNADDYGMVGMLAIFSAIASTIQECGFTTALTNKEKICHEDYNAVFWFSSLSGIFFYVILYCCAPLIASFYNKPELLNLSRVIFLGFLFGGFGVASNAYLFKNLMVKERAKIDIIALILSGIVGVILAWKELAYWGLAIQSIVYIGSSALLKLFCTPWRPSFQLNFKPLKEMFSFSSKLILTNIFTQINANIFSVVLGKFYSSTQLGFYSQGQKWAGMGNQLIGGMINSVAQPVFVEARGNLDRQLVIFRKLQRFVAFFAIPFFMGLIYVAKEFIVFLIGEKWLSSIVFVQIFSIWAIFSAFSVLAMQLLMEKGRSDIILKGNVVTGCLQVVSLFIILKYGVILMASVYVALYVFNVLFWYYLVHKQIKLSFFHCISDVIPYLLLVLLSILLTQLVLNLLNLSIFCVLILKILIFSGCFLSLSWIFGSTLMKEIVLFVKNKNI